MNKDILYLASESKNRQRLLKEVDINFKSISHGADENVVRLKDSFDSYVLDIAKEKMKYINLFKGQEGQTVFVLTADTLVYTHNSKIILGKPKDIDDAKRMLRLLRKDKGEVVTGCCLEKRVYKNNIWQNESGNYWTTVSFVEFIVNEDELDLYFKKLPQSLRSSSGGIIEGYGQRFCKSIEGSYSNIIGLPIFELIQVLKRMNFKF